MSPGVYKGISDADVANAMADRILHHCRVFQIVGPSYRMKGKEDLFKEGWPKVVKIKLPKMVKFSLPLS